MENSLSLKEFDNQFLSEKTNIIAGVDEAGRGPLAGPVVAAAAAFSEDKVIDGINDSKKITKKKRELLFEIIKNDVLSFGIGIIDNMEIDKINILQATLKAMKEAVKMLNVTADIILIDGNKSFYSHIPTTTIIKGDSKSFAIASASILAKVTRDRLMIEAHEKYPQYDWLNNKGYGTKKHIEAIKKYGPTPLHRISFLSNIINTEEQKLKFNSDNYKS